MKVLRPLRVISRNEGLRVSIRSLSVALPGIIDVIIVISFFVFINGIIGVNYFKGRFFNCDDLMDDADRFADLRVVIDTKWDCLNAGSEWRRSFINFDNI